MLALVRLFLMLDLVAIAAECLFPPLRELLPLGGSHLAQLGLILIFVMTYVETKACAAELRRQHDRPVKTPDS